MTNKNEVVKQENAVQAHDESIISSIVLNGDISKLNPDDKVRYYNLFCQSLGLNPVTQPFKVLTLNGKQVLYATKDATEQLRKINKVSIVDMQKEIKNDIFIVTVKGQDKDGRYDISTGAVNIAGLKGDALANAMLKAETKAKRRLTLSISGLGIMDETEIETMPGVKHAEPEIKPIEQNTQPTNSEMDELNMIQADIMKCNSRADIVTLWKVTPNAKKYEALFKNRMAEIETANGGK